MSLMPLVLLLFISGLQCELQGRSRGCLPGAQALDLWTIRGKLSSEPKSLVAITQLSRNLQQSTTWWQLTNVSWHPEALWRFMVLGPPPAGQPPAGQPPNASWGKEQFDQVLKLGGLAGTREAAIAEYRTETGRVGTGQIRLRSWVLMYNCLTTDCDIVAPVILHKDAEGKISYGTLWQNLFSSSPLNPVLLSASTADIIHHIRPEVQQSKNLQLKLAENIGPCNESIAIGRSPLDAAYKVPPGFCYELAPKLRAALNQTRLFVVLQNMPHQSNWPYRRRPLHECSTAPILVKELDEFRCCVFSEVQKVYYCANFTISSYDDTACRNNRDDIGLSNFLLVYSYLNNQTSTQHLSETFQVIYDSVPEAPCNTSGRTKAGIYNIKRNGFDLAHSIWEDTKGVRTEEFKFGRANGSLCYYGLKSDDKENSSYLRRCNITSSLNLTVSRCEAPAMDTDLLEVMFNDSVTAYADEHNTAFNMDRGPATDVFTAWAALVTAAVSVVTATVPCTNLELEYLARYVYPKHHEKLKVVKFSVLALVNVAFGMILYAPIFAMILNESKRSEPYHTWSLVTGDFIVNTYGTRMRSIFIIQGQSIYRSRILWIFVVVCIISFPLIVFITLKRCYKVFYRRKLLLRERISLYGDDAPLSNAEAKEINVKAIEMGLSEFVRLKEQLKGNRQKNN